MENLHYLDEIEPSEAPFAGGPSHQGRDVRSHEARTVEMLKSYVETLSNREDHDELLPHLRGALLRTMFAIDHLRGAPIATAPSIASAGLTDDLAVGSLAS